MVYIVLNCMIKLRSVECASAILFKAEWQKNCYSFKRISLSFYSNLAVVEK